VARILAVHPEREPAAGTAHGSGSAGDLFPEGLGGRLLGRGKGRLRGEDSAETGYEETYEEGGASLHAWTLPRRGTERTRDPQVSSERAIYA